MIPVTKPYLPSRDKLDRYIDGIYERAWLTNNGPLVQELTRRLEAYLGVENLLLVANGTLALQIAYRALGIAGHGNVAEAVTTPFSFVATTSSLQWEGMTPTFADISADSWCLDPQRLEDAITQHTRAIVPVHVFGNGCDVEAINSIARQRDVKTVYDGAHAFGVDYKGESLLKYGDATTLSFHATKLFHSLEGGAIIFKRKEDLQKAKLLINFGITGPERIESLGINAKMNEFQAAMGLCMLEEIDTLMQARKKVWDGYVEELSGKLQLQALNPHCTHNYAYFPVVFENEQTMLNAMNRLKQSDILTRRYFYPSLDTLDYVKAEKQRVSTDIASRILCLPIYPTLEEFDQEKIINVLLKRN